MKKQNIIFLGFILFNVGCSSLKHVDELVLLNNFQREQASTDDYVENQDRLFSELRKAVVDESIKAYLTKGNIENQFGEPIQKKSRGNSEIWMYRQSVKFFESDRIYLTFNQANELLDVKIIKKGE